MLPPGLRYRTRWRTPGRLVPLSISVTGEHSTFRVFGITRLRSALVVVFMTPAALKPILDKAG